MTIKNRIKGIIAAALCMGLLAGCAGSTTSSDSAAGSTDNTSSVVDEVVDSDIEDIDDATVEIGDASSDEVIDENTSGSEIADDVIDETIQADIEYPESISVSAMKGPTAMGMTKLMDEDETLGYPYDFQILASADEVAPLVIQGNTDIVCAPANLASVLYNKTEGGVKVLAVNTLGVLYIVENGNTVTSMEDLRGKTIYASGKGASPEFALYYLLKENGIDPENDVTIEWKSEHSECLAALTSGENGVALLPQPFVTTAMTKAEGINVVLDLTEEWEKLDNGSACLTGVVMARAEFIEQYPEVVEEFLDRYAASVDYVNNNVADAAQLVGKYDIVPAAVAEKAIPECNIVCITGAEMKEKLSGYLNVLFEQLPTSVGGALPADDFYYGA